MQPEAMTGAQSLVKSLECVGAEVVFGIPGGAILPTYDPIMDASFRHILCRHEQAAGHAASGYAHATGKVGVCIATSGPGATNLITPIADAGMDSIPIVAITGQVGAAFIGTDAFQEADIVGMTMPVTKHNYLVQTPEEIPRVVAEAFYLASTGRPGPVLIDVPKNIQQAETTFAWPPTLQLPGYRPRTEPDADAVQEAAALMARARRPVIMAGGGIIRAGATEELIQVAELSHAPVVTTLMGRGALPDTHPQNLGMPGMHGTVAAVTALQRADLILAVGSRFDDRVTGKLDSFAPGAAIIHVDIDPAEISKNRHADVGVVADVREFLRAFGPALRAQFAEHRQHDLRSWWAQLDRLRETYPLGWTATTDGFMAPQEVISRIGALSPDDTIYVSGVGQHQMWASQFIGFEHPQTWINSGGLGTMGYGVPAAMGAKVGEPERTVWAIDGDGCFQMTNQELATCAINHIPIKVALINNNSLGMVRQWQNLFYNGRYSHTDLNTGNGSIGIPDFVKLAEAYGCAALRCSSVDDLDATIQQALEINDRPVVVDFRVSADAMVWPMVPAGVSNDEILVARGLTPEWDTEI